MRSSVMTCALEKWGPVSMTDFSFFPKKTCHTRQSDQFRDKKSEDELDFPGKLRKIQQN